MSLDIFSRFNATFKNHGAIPNVKQAVCNFPNKWEVSIVSGPSGCGVYGNLQENTFEVAIYNPQGVIEGNVFGWQTPDEVLTILERVSGYVNVREVEQPVYSLPSSEESPVQF
jgi:hypothetical protein